MTQGQIDTSASVTTPMAPWSVSVVRRDDFLSLTFTFFNLTLLTNPARLARTSSAYPSYIAITFPPQSIAEQAFHEGVDQASTEPLTLPAHSRLSRPSHLTFVVPDTVPSIPYDLGSLLDACSSYRTIAEELDYLDPRIVGDVPPTSIECPYRLILVPDPSSRWRHRTTPVTHNARTELWHTRLESGAGLWAPGRAVSALDEASPFRMTLDAAHRDEIVKNSMAFPNSIQLNRLMLTSLGAWLEAEAFWPGQTLEAWVHRMAMGRDHYVRAVTAGYLYPFGHRAVRIEVTERTVESVAWAPVAALRQRMCVVVLEREKRYPGATHYPNETGREMPFSRVRITTTVTPKLDDPKDLSTGALNTQGPHWVCFSGGKKFQFSLTAEDMDHRPCDFTAPMIFVPRDVGCKVAAMAAVRSAYASAVIADGLHVKSYLKGQKVAFAPRASSSDSSTTLLTDSVTFGSTISPQDTTDKPCFFPRMETAEVRVPSIEHLMGKTTTVAFAWNLTYQNAGFNALSNKAEAFLDLQPGSSPLQLDFQHRGDMVGGVVTPSFTISRLTRKLGPVGGDTALVTGTFHPASFFGGALQAKLLGGVMLSSILETITDVFTTGTGQVPTLTTQTTDTQVITQLNWDTTQLTNDPRKIFVPSGQSRLTILSTRTAQLMSSAPPTWGITGELKNFQLNLFGFVTVPFDHLRFCSKNGQRPDISLGLGPGRIQFGGPLAFVNGLLDVIPTDMSGNGAGIDVSPAGITTRLSLSLPTIGVGVFTLQNVSFNMGLSIPFTGEPARLRLGFCDRQRPFGLSVYGFGGGGFFSLALGVDGVETLEAALEFGGVAAIDIGIAAGSVHLMAGIYYRWESDRAELTGYLRCGGEVSVLFGLASVSTEFYMSLTYDSGANKVWGEAKLTLEVHILFFSKSWEISVRRQFGGDPNDPTFAHLIPSHALFRQYCGAFA